MKGKRRNSPLPPLPTNFSVIPKQLGTITPTHKKPAFDQALVRSAAGKRVAGGVALIVPAPLQLSCRFALPKA